MNKDMKWYMVSTISGKENKVIEALKNKIISEGIENLISEFKLAMVPHYTPLGKFKEKNMLPGYVFIKMVMTNEVWFLVRNTQYVTGLIGSSGQRTMPTPVSNLEMKRIDKSVKLKWQEYKEGNFTPIIYKEGYIVEVIDGSFKGLQGPVIQVDKINNKLVIDLTLFDRKTPTEVSMDIVKVISK